MSRAPVRQRVLLLPGQGAQAERMASGLLTLPAFAAGVDEVLAPLGPTGRAIRAAWLSPDAETTLDAAAIAQPLLLTLGVALGRALDDCDRSPDVLLGHSVGELAAACISGVIDRADVPTVAAHRADATTGIVPGGMLAVLATEDEVAPYVTEHGDGVAVAAVNGPRQVVLAGPTEALDSIARLLRSAGRTTRRMRSSHAFHSPLLADGARSARATLGRLTLRPPTIPIMSTRTAAYVRQREARDPSFWADQLVRPVRYWPAVLALLDELGLEPGVTFLDASPDQSLGTPLRRHPAVRSGRSRVVPLLDPTGRGEDRATFLGALEF